MASPDLLSAADVLCFDLDMTLARYRVENLSKTVYETLIRGLINDRGYAASSFPVPFDLNLLQKGVMCDFHTGDVLKLGSSGAVALAYHGVRRLSAAEIAEKYGSEPWGALRMLESRQRHDSYFSLMTYFETPISLVFQQLVDHADAKEKEAMAGSEAPASSAAAAAKTTERLLDYGAADAPTCPASYMKFRKDMIDIVDRMYDNNKRAYTDTLSICGMMQRDPHYFIESRPSLGAALIKARSLTGERRRRVILVTNSHLDFAKVVLVGTFGTGWRDCFDLAFFNARKPGFFDAKKAFHHPDWREGLDGRPATSISIDLWGGEEEGGALAGGYHGAHHETSERKHGEGHHASAASSAGNNVSSGTAAGVPHDDGKVLDVSREGATFGNCLLLELMEDAVKFLTTSTHGEALKKTCKAAKLKVQLAEGSSHIHEMVLHSRIGVETASMATLSAGGGGATEAGHDGLFSFHVLPTSATASASSSVEISIGGGEGGSTALPSSSPTSSSPRSYCIRALPDSAAVSLATTLLPASVPPAQHSNVRFAYFGDHIFSDVSASAAASWISVAIIEELECFEPLAHAVKSKIEGPTLSPTNFNLAYRDKCVWGSFFHTTPLQYEGAGADEVGTAVVSSAASSAEPAVSDRSYFCHFLEKHAAYIGTDVERFLDKLLAAS